MISIIFTLPWKLTETVDLIAKWTYLDLNQSRNFHQDICNIEGNYSLSECFFLISIYVYMTVLVQSFDVFWHLIMDFSTWFSTELSIFVILLLIMNMKKYKIFIVVCCVLLVFLYCFMWVFFTALSVCFRLIRLIVQQWYYPCIWPLLIATEMWFW